jgi:hypothetical protein
MTVYQYGDWVPKSEKNTCVIDSARVIRVVLLRRKDFWIYGKQLYIDLAREYPGKLKKL